MKIKQILAQRVVFEFIEQYSQFFTKCNWYTFHPVNFEIENDECMGGFEFSIVLLGIGFRFRYNYDTTFIDAMEDIVFSEIDGR